MELWSSILVSLLLVAVATGLMVWHIRLWRGVQTGDSDQRERDYLFRQYRRRMQTSAMLGLLGVAILVGQLLMPWVSRLFAILYWGGVLLLLAWMGLLALADIIATQQHFSRLRTDYMIERAKLQAEARRIQGARGNGKAPKDESALP